MIEKERIESGFRLRSLAHRIIVLEAIGSTNTYAKLLIDSPDSEGTIVVADEQTSGKGRMTRTWHSPKGGLYFSIVLKANKDVSSYALYALMAACCVHEAVKTESGLTPHLKWPNDILVNERKLCGILSELIIKQEEWDEEVYVILGIGINVNNMTEGFPLDLQDVATSIKMECGCDSSLEDLLVEIVSRIDWWLEGDPILSKVSQVYNNICGTLGAKVIVDMGDRQVQGVAKEIKDDGLLVVEDDSGDVHSIRAGDVIYVRSE